MIDIVSQSLNMDALVLDHIQVIIDSTLEAIVTASYTGIDTDNFPKVNWTAGYSLYHSCSSIHFYHHKIESHNYYYNHSE